MAMNPQAMMKQAKKMQRKMEEAQAALADETVEATAGGGMVTATVTGDQRLVSLAIDPEAIDPDDAELLCDTIVAAVNQGLEDSKELANQRLNAATGGMSIPGLM